MNTTKCFFCEKPGTHYKFYGFGDKFICNEHVKLLSDWVCDFGEFEENIICPYCGEEFADSWDYTENDIVECESCEKEFDLIVEYSAMYLTRRCAADMPPDWTSEDE